MHHNSQRHNGGPVVLGTGLPNCYSMGLLNSAVKLLRMCEVCCVYLACFQVVGIKNKK